MEEKIALVYMVAGLSSRFGGKIKGLIKVGKNGERLVEYSLNQAIPYGINKIIFVVSDKTIEPYRSAFGSEYKVIPIIYALQKFEQFREKPWGTADALISAKEHINGAFIVCNGDDIYGEENFRILADHLRKYNEPATIGYYLGNNIPNEGSVNRGIFKFDKDYVSEIKETLGISKDNLQDLGLNLNNLCSANIFALNLKTLTLLDERVKKFKEEHKNEKKAECYLPTELSYLISNKDIKMKIYKSSEKCLGITNPGDEEILRGELKKNKLNFYMLIAIYLNSIII